MYSYIYSDAWGMPIFTLEVDKKGNVTYNALDEEVEGSIRVDTSDLYVNENLLINKNIKNDFKVLDGTKSTFKIGNTKLEIDNIEYNINEYQKLVSMHNNILDYLILMGIPKVLNVYKIK